MKQLFYKSTLIILIPIYLIGVFVSISKELITDFQAVRFQNQIEKNNNTQVLEFSISDWQKFSYSKEIKFKNHFYDVVSFEEKNSKIIAHVVADNFENEFRVSIVSLLSKHKNSNFIKTKVFSKHLPTNNNFSLTKKIFFWENNEKNYCQKSLFLDNYFNFLEKPPC
jgi:hypothetical protein